MSILTRGYVQHVCKSRPEHGKGSEDWTEKQFDVWAWNYCTECKWGLYRELGGICKDLQRTTDTTRTETPCTTSA